MAEEPHHVDHRRSRAQRLAGALEATCEGDRVVALPDETLATVVV